MVHVGQVIPVKLEDVVELPTEPITLSVFSSLTDALGRPVVHAGVARLHGSNLSHGFTTRLVSILCGNVESEMVTELKPEKLAVQYKA